MKNLHLYVYGYAYKCIIKFHKFLVSLSVMITQFYYTITHVHTGEGAYIMNFIVMVCKRMCSRVHMCIYMYAMCLFLSFIFAKICVTFMHVHVCAWTSVNVYRWLYMYVGVHIYADVYGWSVYIYTFIYYILCNSIKCLSVGETMDMSIQN